MNFYLPKLDANISIIAVGMFFTVTFFPFIWILYPPDSYFAKFLKWISSLTGRK